MNYNRKISVIGLGYIGLPIAVAFSKSGPVIGLDIDKTRITDLVKGIDKTGEIKSAVLLDADITFTSNPADINSADFHIVTVPTPVDDAKNPDLGPLIRATEIVGLNLKKDDIVVYESTVYPGATEEECIPLLEKTSGLKAGRDFFVGYSPERINPGDDQHVFENIKKVVSAQTPEVLDIIAKVYGGVVKAGIYRASSIKVAEAAKVIENTQRDLNISLVNELAIIFNKMGIDTRDVLHAAGTKWNFIPFDPGLVGGHCIGVDPYYLTYQAEKNGYLPQVILAGRRINDGMGKYIANQLMKKLLAKDSRINNTRVTILGFTFKENVPDIRNTRVIDIVRELEEYDVSVQICDPLADPDEIKQEYGVSLTRFNDLLPCQAVILAVPHREYLEMGWSLVTGILDKKQGVVVDVRACLPREETPRGILLWRL